MESLEFIKNFADQIEEINSNELNLDTAFRDIEGWSSLISLSIIAMVDEIYKVRLTGEEIRNSRTIGDIFDIIKSKL